jgi:hypothetical protein
MTSENPNVNHEEALEDDIDLSDVEPVIDDRQQKTAYVWDRKKMLLVGTVLADPDPLDLENWIKPFCSTFDEPPPVEKNQAVARDVESNEWIVKADFRGTEYWYVDGTRHTIEEVGEEVPEGALLEAPVIPLTDEQRAAIVRAQRDTLIDRVSREIERRQDVGEVVTAWREYRQFLRDIPDQSGFPKDIDWGVQPAEFTGK